MPTFIAGQNFDLTDSPENIVLNLIRDNWNENRDGQIPGKTEIGFATLGFSGRKSYQVSVEPSSAPFIEYLSMPPQQYIKYNDPVVIHVWIVKNKDTVPPQMHHITQKIEQIVYENVNNVGYGLTAIKMLAPFSAIEVREYFSQETGMQTSFQNQTAQSMWHSQAMIELMYFKVVTTQYPKTRAFKTHKYNTEVTE